MRLGSFRSPREPKKREAAVPATKRGPEVPICVSLQSTAEHRAGLWDVLLQFRGGTTGSSKAPLGPLFCRAGLLQLCRASLSPPCLPGFMSSRGILIGLGSDNVDVWTESSLLFSQLVNCSMKTASAASRTTHTLGCTREQVQIALVCY